MNNKEKKDPILEARKVSKTYQEGAVETQVLRDLSLSIEEGSFTAVTGQSGVGKSTLLHILGLIDRPTEGAVFYRDKDAASIQRKERARIRNYDFGFIFQAYHLIHELTAMENVLIPAMLGPFRQWFSSRAEAKERAESLLERVGLKERIRHRPLQLSGGERQRVAIARALINKPEVLFCDEPTGNLDEKTSEGVFELVRKLHEEEGVTLVLVTHEMRYAGKAPVRYRIHAGTAEKQET